MDNKTAHIAELQELCKRTLTILDEEHFFENTVDAEFWHSSLHRDLTNASNGKELKTFNKMYKLAHDVIKDLENR